MKHRLASGPRGICGLDLILHFAFDGKQRAAVFFLCVSSFHANKLYFEKLFDIVTVMAKVWSQ